MWGHGVLWIVACKGLYGQTSSTTRCSQILVKC
jgi:hypothetical protein